MVDNFFQPGYFNRLCYEFFRKIIVYQKEQFKDLKMGNIVENCKGCNKIDSNENCLVYPNPTSQMRWVEGKSNIGCAFHRSKHVNHNKPKQKIRVGQQKQKKN